uniref:Uncharacterized protein n=1 Tax=Ascaris lumbricoides TaxID=6252 RepID=A0A0M3HLV1_ASCLU
MRPFLQYITTKSTIQKQRDFILKDSHLKNIKRTIR